MHRNVRTFLAAAAELGLSIEPREFDDSTHTAADAAAGTPNVNFGIAPAELVRASGGVVCDVAVRA